MNAKEVTISKVGKSNKGRNAALHGQGLRTSVEARRRELELELVEIQKSREPSPLVESIECGLNALDGLTAGSDLEDISAVTAALLNQWLESTKNLTGKKARGARPQPIAERSAVASSTEGFDETTVQHGQELLARVDNRRRELTETLGRLRAALPEGHISIDAVEDSLHSLEGLLVGATGDLSEVVAAQLAEWLANTTYLVQPSPRHGHSHHAAM